MSFETDDGLLIRRADEGDLDAIIEVCAAALAWDPGAPNETFFRWKHQHNAFGPSAIWVAEDGGRIVGVRTMMRWAMVDQAGGLLRMVRAVDTATLPSHQGRRIFTSLTMAAVSALTEEGVDAVFNTPNVKSRPGYLKMGWQELGRAHVAVRPRSPSAVLAMARSRTAADKWGEATSTGVEPAEVLADESAVDELLHAVGRPAGWSTDRSVAYLRWRYGLTELNYRFHPLGTKITDGLVAYRLRRRGELLELSLNEVLDPSGGRLLGRQLSPLLRLTGADVALASRSDSALRSGLVPLPNAGPIVTWRPLDNPTVPTMQHLALSLGTLELF